MQRGVAHPDLLVTTHSYPTDKDSLMEEIAQKEGMASPLLRREHVLQPSPFLRSTRSGSFIRKKKKKPSNLKSNAVLSLSLPNLADVDELESPLPNTNRFSVIIPSSYDKLVFPPPSLPPHMHFTCSSHAWPFPSHPHMQLTCMPHMPSQSSSHAQLSLPSHPHTQLTCIHGVSSHALPVILTCYSHASHMLLTCLHSDSLSTPS